MHGKTEDNFQKSLQNSTEKLDGEEPVEKWGIYQQLL